MTTGEKCNVPPHFSPYLNPFHSFFAVLREWFPTLLEAIFAAAVFIFLEVDGKRNGRPQGPDSAHSWPSSRDTYVCSRTCAAVSSAGSLFLPPMSKDVGIDTELRSEFLSVTRCCRGNKKSCCPLFRVGNLSHDVAHPRTLQARLPILVTLVLFSCVWWAVVPLSFLAFCSIFHVRFSFLSWGLLSGFIVLHVWEVFAPFSAWI